MSNISVDHGDRIYWLGRYSERVFMTLRSLKRLYDKVIDKDPDHYKLYLDCFGVPDTYEGYKDFFLSFIFDKNNPCSAAYSLERAYDNGIVLREEISTDALAYLQLAMDKLAEAEKAPRGLVVTLMPLEDILYSFWGCYFDKVYSNEIRDIFLCGKSVERLEMMMRLKYRSDKVYLEFKRLCDNLARIPKNTPYRYNTEQLSALVEIMGVDGNYTDKRNEALAALSKLFDPVNRR